MSVTALFIAIGIALGLFAAATTREPVVWPSSAHPMLTHGFNQFSPRRTIFIFGTEPDNPGCQLQRRLLKPAVATIIGEDIRVIEVYANLPARQNGNEIKWLDPSLLRHAMDAESGFLLIYVDDNGQTALRSEAPVIAADIFEHAGLGAPDTIEAAKSAVLKKLSAA